MGLSSDQLRKVVKEFFASKQMINFEEAVELGKLLASMSEGNFAKDLADVQYRENKIHIN